MTPGLSPQGPKGESVGSITQPLPSSYLIFRAASESDGESPPALQGSPVTPRDLGAPADLHTRCTWPLFRPSHCPPRRRRPSLGSGQAGLRLDSLVPPRASVSPK